MTLLSVLLLAAIAAPLTSCSRNPVSPASSRAGSPGAGTLSKGEVDDPTGPPMGGPGATASIRLGVGESGMVKAGRFTLFIHKNTLNVPAQFSLWVPNPQSMQVDIDVMPPIANDFQVPAHLTADMSDQPSLDLSRQTMYYWDGIWEVPSSDDVYFDDGAHTITANMKSLIRCLVGPLGKVKNHLSN